MDPGPVRWASRLKGEERHPLFRSLGQPFRGLDFSAEEFLVEWGESSLDHDGVEMLEDLQLFHVLAAQASEFPLGWQLEIGKQGRRVSTSAHSPEQISPFLGQENPPQLPPMHLALLDQSNLFDRSNKV